MPGGGVSSRRVNSSGVGGVGETGGNGMKLKIDEILSFSHFFSIAKCAGFEKDNARNDICAWYKWKLKIQTNNERKERRGKKHTIAVCHLSFSSKETLLIKNFHLQPLVNSSSYADWKLMCDRILNGWELKNFLFSALFWRGFSQRELERSWFAINPLPSTLPCGKTHHRVNVWRHWNRAWKRKGRMWKNLSFSN